MSAITAHVDHATLINVFTVEPERARQLADLLTAATEDMMQHIDGFISANIHLSTDGTRSSTTRSGATRRRSRRCCRTPRPSDTWRSVPSWPTATTRTCTPSSRCIPRSHDGAMATTRRTEGKLADITGPGITDRWGVTCTDLGASIVAPNGTLISVFGDTFSGDRVGQGDWRSPVILIGTGDASHHAISYHRAGGSRS